MLHTNSTAQAIDDVLAATFPASDPPAWTPGVARPAPALAGEATAPGALQPDITRARRVIDASRPTHSRTFAQGVVSLIGAAALSLLVPVAVLAVGLPVALAARGLLEAIDWVLAVVR